MSTLYIECKMGAAGDMLMAALYELLSPSQKEQFLKTMNALLPGELEVHAISDTKCGIRGTHIQVLVHGKEEAPCMPSEEHAHADNARHDHDLSAQEHTHADHVHDADSARPDHGLSAPEHTHSLGFNDVHALSEPAHTHEQHSYHSILEKIKALPIPSEVASDAAAVYCLIGEAEASVHGSSLDQIHFHEVGSLDALADVVGCCLLFHEIGAEQILASPIHVGNGTVHCAHGILPVPAPATAKLLEGIPFYTGTIMSELCTPTGAAILRHFASDFGAMPPMLTSQIGLGLGTKDFPVANCVRIFLGTTVDASDDTSSAGFQPAGEAATEALQADHIVDLSCNLDDMTGEDLGYCMDLLLAGGALDVFYQPIQMKKNRPGILLHCFCEESDRDRFIRLLLLHTTTRGVRYTNYSRAKLVSHFEEVATPYGTVRNKISTGYGVTKSKYEYEDLKKIAQQEKISLAELRRQL